METPKPEGLPHFGLHLQPHFHNVVNQPGLDVFSAGKNRGVSANELAPTE